MPFYAIVSTLVFARVSALIFAVVFAFVFARVSACVFAVVSAFVSFSVCLGTQ